MAGHIWKFSLFSRDGEKKLFKESSRAYLGAMTQLGLPRPDRWGIGEAGKTESLAPRELGEIWLAVRA